MRYNIVEAKTLRDIEIQIQKRIDAGWKLKGDLVVFINEDEENVFAHEVVLDVGKK